MCLLSSADVTACIQLLDVAAYVPLLDVHGTSLGLVGATAGALSAFGAV